MAARDVVSGKLGVRGFIAVVVLASLGCSGSGNDAGDANGADAAVPAPSAPARVTIVEPAEGAELNGTSVLITLSVDNIALAPAGDTTSRTGHHHLFVNAVPVAAGEAIPAGVPGVVHLGKAQTSYELTALSAGEYMVIAVLGDFAHRRIEPQVVDTVRFRIR